MNAPATAPGAKAKSVGTGNPVRVGVLQRKCACGTSKAQSGQTCEECSQRSLQRKLVVGRSDDPFELEADRIAEQVLGRATIDARHAPRISRIPASAVGTGAAESPAPASVEQAIRSSGQPIEPALRADMERRFGYDFGAVRIHTDGAAARSARDVNARAYTIGANIVFDAGQFAPATMAGRRLLAHELTHVVQQSGPMRQEASASPPKAQRVQRDKAIREPVVLPEPVTKDDQTHWYHDQGQWFYADLRSNIQWHLNRFDPRDFMLVVVSNAKQRAQLAAEKRGSASLARYCGGLVEGAVGATFAHGGKQLIDYFEKYLRPIEQPWPHDEQFIGIPVTLEMLRAQFLETEFDAYIESLNAALRPNEIWPLLSESDFPFSSIAGSGQGGGTGGSKAHRKLDPWVADKKRKLQELIDQLRARTADRPTDLPDRLVPWFNERDSSWYLNVWIHFDVAGKIAEHKAIRLKQGERIEDLYERTVQAVHDAYEGARGEERKRREAEMPQWAIDLKKKVDSAFGDEEGEEIPDGMALTLDGRGARTPGPGKQNVAQAESSDTLETQVLLRIWVFRGEKKATNRKQGSVPIFPATEPDKLVAYVRNLAAILRQGEHIPDDAEFNPTHELGQQMLPNFEARILPRDLRSENITVTEATNEFSLFLDFDKQYNAIGADPIYVASKLYSQTIYYDWKIYQVPPVAEISPAGPSDQEWVTQWPKLYEHYNPRSGVLDGDIRATTQAGTVAIPPVGFDTGDDDLTTRVSFPDTPGDYLVSCQTRHKPIGDANLRRVSSVAYYPVRTRTRDQLAVPRVTKVTSGLASVDEELKDIQLRLAENEKVPGTLTDIEKKVLEQTLRDLTVQKSLFEKREHGGLVSNIDMQIADGTAKLQVAVRLRKRLPEILAQAKTNAESGAGSSKPTELLADDPELLTLYLRLKLEGKHAAGYVNELTNDIADLRKTRQRVAKFDEDFQDAPAGACTYTPEAVFVSKVNGLIYPMMLMVRESRPKKSYEKVAYTAVDVSTPETTKRYRGFSSKTGADGHREAIDMAIQKIGDSAIYGDGWIAVRMPPGGPGPECAARRRPEIKYYDSEVGFLDKVLKILGILAMFIGAIALALTGFGAAGAGALLGVIAATLGAVDAARKLSDRSDRKTLEFDAETVMDVLAIIGLGEAVAAARLATLPRAMRGFQAYERLGRYLALYQLGSGTANALLIPIQLIEDLNKIEALNLPADKKREMIRAAWGNFAMNIVMTGSMAAHSRLASRSQQNKLPVEEDYAAVREQAELASLDETTMPKSLREQGWLDSDGNWTDKAPEPIRQRVAELAAEARGAPVPPPEVSDVAQKAIDKVNRGEARIEGKVPGERRADLGDGHEIVEKKKRDGIACEYHSPGGPEIPCPAGLGAPATRAADAPVPKAKAGESDVAAPARKPAEAEARPRAVGDEGEVPKTMEQLRDEARTELAGLNAKIAANDQKIRENKPALAAELAKVEAARSAYTSTPHGNDDSDAGRANMRKKRKARRQMLDAEDAYKKVEDRSNGPARENKEHYERIARIKEFLDPKPETSGAKGAKAEEQCDVAIQAGKTETVAGSAKNFQGKFKWLGSSQKPGDPRKQGKPQGLDGGYENLGNEGPKHMAAEFKHEDTPLAPGQETFAWVDDRLDDALGSLRGERMRKEGFEYWVFRYRPGTQTVEAKFMWEWRPTGQKGPRGNWLGTIHYHPIQ